MKRFKVILDSYIEEIKAASYSCIEEGGFTWLDFIDQNNSLVAKFKADKIIGIIEMYVYVDALCIGKSYTVTTEPQE